MKYLSRENLKKWQGKTCLLRVDLNIEPGEEKNSFRLLSILPTVKLLLKNKIKVILLSHRGRPKTVNPKSEIRNPKLSLRPFVPILQKKLRQKLIFVPNLESLKTINHKPKANVFLLENLRFYPGEAKNDPKFARKLASLGDFSVNEAFAVSHRKNASVAAITRYLPSYGGLLLEKEIKNLDGILKYAARPLVIVLGGAKISDKIGLINYFWRRTDKFLLGGGPANTFFAARGLPVGKSLVDRGSIPQILKLIRKEVEPRKIVLPLDVKIKDKKILDIGERTISWYSAIIKKSRTVIWSGPMGFFEDRKFADGTIGIWRAILRNKKAKIIVGGGETTVSLRLLGARQLGSRGYRLMPKNLFLSTGGGAMLEYLSGKKLPGIEALK